MTTQTLNRYQLASKAFFNDIEGKPFEMTPTQSEIFRLVYDPTILRAAITTPTQFGKSDVVSQALILTCTSRVEKVLIVAPKEEQAQIIMGYIIDHLFDNALTTGTIIYEGSLERLKQERSKRAITFRNGSEIRVITANVRTLSEEGKSLMGFGATIVVVDEASLIPDNIFSKILRMIGGVKRGKLIKLGNPFNKNHFWRSLNSQRYSKVWIDYKVAIAEGRMSPDFVQEARDEMPPMDFMIFYEVKFPEGGAEDALIPIDWIELAAHTKGLAFGDKVQAGLDVARFGRDKTVFVTRKGGVVVRMEVKEQMDTMAVAGWASDFIDKDKPEVTAVDVVGIGSGVYDRLDELGKAVAPVNVGEAASTEQNKKKFHNLRAELFWNLRNWFKPEDGRSHVQIPDDPDLKRQLSEIRYKYSSERKIRIEDKDDMKQRIGESPDKADALALAFYEGLTVAEPELIIY